MHVWNYRMQDQVRDTQESSEQVIVTVAGGQLTFTLADLRGPSVIYTGAGGQLTSGWIIMGWNNRLILMYLKQVS